jgi:AraC-like DNA-binding protein
MLKNGSDLLKCTRNKFDVLDDIIETLRFRGSIFFHSSLAAPWGMNFSAMEIPRFHISLEGSFYVGIDDKHANVQPMDIVMIPNGEMHWMADHPERKLVSSDDAGDACSLGIPLFQKGEITNRVMCGLVEYDEAINHPILNVLPAIVHLSNIKENDSIWLTIKLIDNEIVRSQSKKNSIVDRLTEVLFILLLKKYISENEHLTGFLSALHEPRLKKVLQLIHQYPEKPWNLDAICNEVGMSRATLQRKFKSGIGIAPMVYVSRWRMAKAYQLLKYSNLSLEDIAERVGFSDARTFRTAFKKQFDLTPSVVRTSAK